MRVIGVDDKGNVIVEKTSGIGKTDEIILMADIVSAIEEFRAAALKTFREIMQALMPVFQQLAEECAKFSNAVSDQNEQQLADIMEAMKRAAEIQEENRIRREIRAVQRKQCSRIRSRTRQQAKSTLKYKRYELRIYGRKERRGFHE